MKWTPSGFIKEKVEQVKKFLIFFGLLWIALWSVPGIFIEFQQQANLDKMEIYAKSRNLEQYLSARSSWELNINACAHAAYLSIFVIIIGLILTDINASDRYKKIIVLFLVLGVVLASIFKWLVIMPVMALGDGLVIVAILMTLVGIIEKE